MLKTVDELKRQALDKHITLYPVHACSLCGYQCGYIITKNGEQISYDSGCYCVDQMVIEPRDWDDLAKTYNLNQPENNPRVKKEFLDQLDKTWKFGISNASAA